MLAVKEYAPGVYDISNEEYHASAGISRSGIKEFRKTPKNYWDVYLNPNPPKREHSPDLILGEALHTLILEPHQFDTKFCVAPDINKRTKQGKQEWAEFKLGLAGRAIITNKQIDTAKIFADEILAHPDANLLIKRQGAMYEKSIYWQDEETGLLCKCRPDIWHNNILVDIKTAQSAEDTSFGYSISSYDYHIQAAMMIDAVKKIANQDHKNFIFIVVEKERPYCVRTIELDEEDISLGQSEYKNYLKRMKVCFEKNEWPGYPHTRIKLSEFIRNKRMELCQQL